MCEKTDSVARAWCVELAGEEILRPATGRDRLALTWLLTTSRWTHESRGHESLGQLIGRGPSVLWLRKGSIRGAFLVSLYRRPVATARGVALRREQDREHFFDLALPVLETQVARSGGRWLSFSGCADWLVQEIASRGYRLKDRVISYGRAELDTPALGDRQVVVRAATDQDIAQVIGLDAAAFEAFWRLNQEIISRGVRECPCFLVAELDGPLVGYLMAGEWNQRVYISRVAVAPDTRRRGIGTRLIREALILMRRRGLSEALLNTQESNSHAQRLYEKLGFQLTGETEAFWAKPLAASPPEL